MVQSLYMYCIILYMYCKVYTCIYLLWLTPNVHTQIYTENARSFLPKNFMCKYVCGLYGGGKGKTIIKKSYRGLKDMAVEILLFWIGFFFNMRISVLWIWPIFGSVIRFSHFRSRFLVSCAVCRFFSNLVFGFRFLQLSTMMAMFQGLLSEWRLHPRPQSR